jgi:hypothetical protein
MLVSFTLVIIAGILNAFMDKWMIKYQLLSEADEAKLNPSWWSYNPMAKWKDGEYGTVREENFLLKKIGIKTSWLTDNCNDAWHFFKSLMIVLLCIAIVAYTSINTTLISKIVELILLGAAWNLPFNLIFNNKKLNK